MFKEIVLTAVLLSSVVYAAESRAKIIACEPTEIYKCTLDKCEKFQVVNIDEIQYFEIDPEKKTLTGKIGNSQLEIEHIASRHGNENTFVFFGTHADSNFDWLLRINKKSRKMILQSTNENLDGFTIYGSCKWEEGS